MLSLLGFLMIAIFMYLVMSKRFSALTALIIVPSIFALIVGVKPAGLGPIILKSLKDVAPTSIMLMFAIIYFGLMINVGLFDPLIKWLLKIVKGDPLKVIVGTIFMTALVSLDGDGSTTFMIVTTALLPVYKKLGIKPVILASIALMTNSVMNILPWGGPTARVLASLKLDANQVFNPLIIPMILSVAFLVFVSYIIGKQQRAKLGIVTDEAIEEMAGAIETQEPELKRPRLFWINLILTALLLAGLILQWMPIPVLFQLAAALALVINYPSLKEQQERIAANAPNALAVSSLVLAAGVLMGVLTETHMSDAMAKSLLSIIPPALGPHLAVLTAFISAPGTFFLSNDAYYFGIVPIIAKTAASYGISTQVIARASLMAQPIHFLSPILPCLWVLLGLTGVDLGEIQKYCLPIGIGIIFVNVISGVLLGIIPL